MGPTRLKHQMSDVKQPLWVKENHDEEASVDTTICHLVIQVAYGLDVLIG